MKSLSKFKNNNNDTNSEFINITKVVNGLITDISNRVSECATKEYVGTITKALHRMERKDYRDFYLYVTEPNIQADIDIEKLCRIGETIIIFLNEHNILDAYNSLFQFKNPFSISLAYALSLYSEYKSISEATAKHIDEISHCHMFIDLTANIIRIIETLPNNLFYDLKRRFPEELPEKGIRKRYRKLLFRLTENRGTIGEKYQLLIDKNFLVIELGFSHFIPSLLDSLLSNQPLNI
jgi:hypothetical protein